MFNSTPDNDRIFSTALLTVCVEPETMDEIVQTVEGMPWVLVTADFEAYISASRRPNLSQQIKMTNACIAVGDFDQDPEQAVETTKYLQQLFPGKVAIVALSESQD